MMKKLAMGLLAVLWLSGCTELDNPPDSSTAPVSAKSQGELETISKCRTIETSLIQVDLVFQDTLAFAGIADTRESSAFFAEISPISDILLDISFGENQVSEGVSQASNSLASAVSDVQGLMSTDFDPHQVGEILRPSIEGLFFECAKVTEVSTETSQLFVAPELIEFDIEARDADGNDPLIRTLRESGLSCNTNYIEPFLVADIAPLKPFYSIVCIGDDGNLILRRHESNLDSIRSARQLSEELAADIEGGVLVSDQYSGIAWVLDDAVATESLSNLLAFQLEMERYGLD
jgi:hypothetical protein